MPPPDRPFLTESFSPRGGGIDFLGMRQVNLSILEELLIPGLNNQTADLGYYFLATWVPWKFRRLSRRETFTPANYRRFRGAVEVAAAYTMRDGSPSAERLGAPRLRIGVEQSLPLPGPLAFEAAGRTDATSFYAPPLYGPSLRYLGLMVASAQAEDGSPLGVPIAVEDEATEAIAAEVEAALASCGASRVLDAPGDAEADGATLDQLGEHGLNPAYYRSASPRAKGAFLDKLLRPREPGDQADRRRLTARLICETLRQGGLAGEASLRRSWHTGFLSDAAPLVLGEPDLRRHRETWAIFQSRQIQRTIAETFLRCFELAIAEGCLSVDGVLDYWRGHSQFLGGPAPPSGMTLERLVLDEAGTLADGADWRRLSEAWHGQVHGRHPLYEDIDATTADAELDRALRMLVRWWVRVQKWLDEEPLQILLARGGRDRMSIRWFSGWIACRLPRTLEALLREIFSELVFAQHLRVALARFDGQVQRLRFTLGDEGIIPTAEARDKLGQAPSRMADRLVAFMDLLFDLDVLRRSEAKPVILGANARLVPTTVESRATPSSPPVEAGT